ncbi:MAG: hypothetical protein H6Q20_2184 [Bacteroidetes bacterium]|nr:hypothetical protein [Bacteroidota bacterium]
MKKLYFFITFVALAATLFSCKEDEVIKTYEVNVQLSYPSGYETADSVAVTLTNTISKSSYTLKTDADGKVTFQVPVGAYEASATERRSEGGIGYNFNGLVSVTVTDNWVPTTPVNIELVVSKSSQLVIKELYIGGCQKDDGSGAFSRDQYVILYNNSDYDASLANVCLGAVVPSNSNVTNKDYVDGALSYTDWIPAGYGIWYFQNEVTLAPGKQIVIALTNAVDNTVTYSKSINFANAEYYCTYDIASGFNHTSYYPAPSIAIPESHFLKAVRYSGVTANAWSLSNTSPAFFIFAPQDVTPVDFANDADRTNLYGGSSTQARKKVPLDWVIDGIEVFKQGTTNYKRLLASVDAGYINHINAQGYTLYRNVDKTATEAIAANAGKLVYSYTGGTTDVTDGTTDTSGIDAEASFKNGARIIYLDTNNSSNDFHQRKVASLR